MKRTRGHLLTFLNSFKRRRRARRITAVRLTRRPPCGSLHRGGAILALVLVSMLVATSLGLALTRTVLIHHRQMHSLADRQQAFWLAEAALQRAARALNALPDYSGETWVVSGDVLGRGSSAEVTIEVADSPTPAEGREIQVVAHLERDSESVAVARREMTVGSRQQQSK